MNRTESTNIQMTQEKRLARLEETVQAMIVLLRQESEAVKAINVQAFNNLQTMKNSLFDIYHEDLKALLARKGDLKTLPESAKQRIRKFEQDLSIARVENMSVLERAGKSFTRLRDRIVQVARDSVLRKTAPYGSNGMLQMNARKAISTGVQDHV